jgi:uncharacterized damage-inducible protein DinB
MPDNRIDAGLAADERDMLEGWLAYHRGTLELKCEGLNADELRRRSIPTTNLTLLGLVRHMAEVERHWFRKMLEGEDAPEIYFSATDRDADFNDLSSHEPKEVFEIWRGQVARADEISSSHSLDDLSVRMDGRQERFNLRWILVHMIEEYARHNGHADLIREALDGVTGD